ncbi:hypothetical protein DPMN_144899 [Dreissena polymorpha]|uniref:Uncharacterized protein n=1 Tax=Dreissena polymorpha TaxID=45954 RepID=A0A9D4F4Z2_DREPO|nr:hypothetical protein DPMN_144899 [Dreissena polymorpha]
MLYEFQTRYVHIASSPDSVRTYSFQYIPLIAVLVDSKGVVHVLVVRYNPHPGPIRGNVKCVDNGPHELYLIAEVDNVTVIRAVEDKYNFRCVSGSLRKTCKCV